MLVSAILIRATALVVVGFFVLFAASKVEGNLKSFGKYLALWLFVLPVLLIILAVAMPRPYGHRGFGMRGHMYPMGIMHGMGGPSGPIFWHWGGHGQQQTGAPPAGGEETAPSAGSQSPAPSGK